ncbi:MAG: glycosyltransferase family 4 protein [Bacillota bacterium]
MESKIKKRIGIDARFYGPVGKGLGRYVQEVADRVIAGGKDEFEFVVFLSQDNFESFSCPPNAVKRLVRLRWYSWREQVFFPRLIAREKLDLIHFPHFNVPLFTPVPFIVTIHDLILTRFPSRRASMLPPVIYWLKQIAYRVVVRSAIQRAREVITVSEFTKNDIIERFKADPDKIRITYEGVADLSGEQETDSASVLLKYGISRPFLLYVGNAYPHKNLDRLLEAYSALRKNRPEFSLVMVGKHDYFYRRIIEQAETLGLNASMQGKAVFPGFVPDADLSSLYKEASLYIFPSLYEGFGLPPLEAMSHSCPVVSSDQGSLPEILSDAAEYFNPYEAGNIAAAIERVLADNRRQQELVTRGREHISKYSWQDCARKTLDSYRQALR